jgi:hypothetical protein
VATKGELAAQPEAGGDEARVREIAHRWWEQLEVPLTSRNKWAVFEAVRETYAAGIAAGRAAGERDEREYWLRRARSRSVQYVTVEELEDARRGGGT